MIPQQSTRRDWHAAWARVRRNRTEVYTLVCRRGDAIRVWAVDCHGVRPITAGPRPEEISAELAQIRRLFRLSPPGARDDVRNAFNYNLGQTKGVAA